MIVSFADLVDLRSLVVMVDGSFDPIHEGHIAYFRAAAALGMPVLCNVATDEWTLSKHQVLLGQAKRGLVLDSIRYISYVHLATVSTAEVIEQLRPKVYAKGIDWLNRGGIPSHEAHICEAHNVKVEYLDTVSNSSSALLERLTGKGN